VSIPLLIDLLLPAKNLRTAANVPADFAGFLSFDDSLKAQINFFINEPL